ncbi:hypothetical protein GJR96_14755 [Haloferax sp. MBLA0076]|uniref:Uncharacterized protein n=1 Tax=Haloferax litoreum TaxID=2666140 RepID=A0A6A8GN24_9EURY|nr:MULTISPECIES: hypothetical protein [Haloferax]KAB1194633.1 hypothetical protein Hfx1148_14685 [Haloferax sp. CBA1148]MRX23210.1 hypothetical protein [Haloferax litoreum]
MFRQGFLRRAVKAGGPPAVITAGIGVGATGLVGQRIESKTDPIARGVAQTLGIDPQMGPAVLVVVAILVFAVALVVPELFDDGRY